MGNPRVLIGHSRSVCDWGDHSLPNQGLTEDNHIRAAAGVRYYVSYVGPVYEPAITPPPERSRTEPIDIISYCPSKGYRKLVVQMIPICALGPIEREIILCVAYNIVGIGVISIQVGDHLLSICLATWSVVSDVGYKTCDYAGNYG